MEVQVGFTVVFVLLCSLVATTYGGGPVARARVEQFAKRQRIEITVDNGEQVIRYLALTRRWRVSGLFAGIFLASAAVSQTHWTSSLFAALVSIVGWFVGALVAELLQASVPTAPRRVASLARRTGSRYLGAPARLLVPALTLLSLAGWIVTVATVRPRPWFPAITAPAVGALLIAAVVIGVQRHVVSRAQPLLPPDQLAADDAIRSRSLHVLTGTGATLNLMCVADQLVRAAASFSAATAWHHHLIVAAKLVAVGGVVLGWLIATRPMNEKSRRSTLETEAAIPIAAA